MTPRRWWRNAPNYVPKKRPRGWGCHILAAFKRPARLVEYKWQGEVYLFYIPPRQFEYHATKGWRSYHVA